MVRMKRIFEYIAPTIDLCEVEVEQGFGVSGGAGSGSYQPWTYAPEEEDPIDENSY